MFFVVFRSEITEKDLKLTKRLKTAEKSVSTSFWVRAAPKAGRNTQQGANPTIFLFL